MKYGSQEWIHSHGHWSLPPGLAVAAALTPYLHQPCSPPSLRQLHWPPASLLSGLRPEPHCNSSPAGSESKPHTPTIFPQASVRCQLAGRRSLAAGPPPRPQPPSTPRCTWRHPRSGGGGRGAQERSAPAAAPGPTCWPGGSRADTGSRCSHLNTNSEKALASPLPPSAPSQAPFSPGKGPTPVCAFPTDSPLHTCQLNCDPPATLKLAQLGIK